MSSWCNVPTGADCDCGTRRNPGTKCACRDGRTACSLCGHSPKPKEVVASAESDDLDDGQLADAGAAGGESAG